MWLCYCRLCFCFLTLCSEGSKGGRGGGEEDEEQRRCEKQLPNTVGGGRSEALQS